MGVSGQRFAPAALPQWRDLVPTWRGWVGNRDELDWFPWRKENPWPPRVFESRAFQSAASRYTDYVILTRYTCSYHLHLCNKPTKAHWKNTFYHILLLTHLSLSLLPVNIS